MRSEPGTEAARAEHTRGTLIMLLVVAIWGAFLPVGKAALAAIDPYWLSLLRFGGAGIVFFILLRSREGAIRLPPRPELTHAAAFGAIGFAGFGISMFEGLRLTRPELGAMILAIGPVLTVLFQWWQSGRRPDGFTFGVIGVAMVGEALVITAGDVRRLAGGDMLGNLLMFAAACFWTAYTLGGQRFPTWSPVRYSAVTCAAGWLMIAAATVAATLLDHSRPPAPADLIKVWPQLAYVVIVVSVFGILLWNTAVAKIGPLSAGLIANFAPVITYLIAIAQGRVPAPAELAGVVIVLAALVANSLHQRRRVIGPAAATT